MRIEEIITGERRAFNFLEPYDRILTNKTVYEVTKTYTLRSMLNDGFNPLDNIYKQYELTESDFQEDLNENMVIVELTLGVNKYYIPIDRMVSKAAETNVHYSERIIGIKLGFIPESEKLDSILDDLRIFIEESLGIKTENGIGDRVMSSTVSIPEQEHINRENERELVRQDPSNYKKKYYNCMLNLSKLDGKLGAIEDAEKNAGLASTKPSVVDLRGLNG